jgi:hypothetical protein
VPGRPSRSAISSARSATVSASSCGSAAVSTRHVKSAPAVNSRASIASSPAAAASSRPRAISSSIRCRVAAIALLALQRVGASAHFQRSRAMSADGSPAVTPCSSARSYASKAFSICSAIQ